MPGSNNFLPFNPAAANQLTDADYAAHALRTGGAALQAILPSNVANKLFFQVSTFAAFAQALANKGYVMSDANLAGLTATVQNVMTQADMGPYATLDGAALTNATTSTTPPTAMLAAASRTRSGSMPTSLRLPGCKPITHPSLTSPTPTRRR